MSWLFAYFTVLAAWLAYRRVPLFHPSMITTLVWLCVIVLSAIKLVEYPGMALRWQTILFVIACHTALIIGIGFLKRVPGPPRTAFEPGYESIVYAAIAGLFVAAQWSSSLLDGNIPVLGTAQDIAAARERLWAGESGGILQQIARVLGYPSIGFVALFPVYLRTRRYGFAALSGATFFAVADLSLAEGGRATLVFAAIMTGVVYIAGARSLSRYAVMGLLGCALLLPLASNFHLTRNPAFASNPDVFIAYNCMGGHLGPLTENASPGVQALAQSSCYATTPVHTLDDFTVRWAGDHTFGLYSGGLLAPAVFEEIREEIAWYYRAARKAPNPWATTMRDFWLDFGYFAVLAFIPLGMIVGAATRNPHLSDEAHAIRYAAAIVAAVMIPFMSPLLLRGIVYPFVATWLITAAAFLIRPRGRRRPVLR